jgi:hypothetical protein
VITYELTCAGNHRFEGWFANREAFEEQMADRRIRCPVCDSVEVRKLPSAVAVHVGRSPEGGQVRRDSKPAAVKPVVEGFFRALGEFVEKNFDDVGTAFAEEARKMHRGEGSSRSIRGSTTPTEEESLRDEGIDFLKIALPKYDA